MLASPESPELSLWKRGFSLAAALKRFGNSEAVTAYREVMAETVESRLLPPFRPGADVSAYVLELQAHWQPSLALNRKRRERQDVLRRDLLAHLHCDRLIGYGYTLPRNAEDPPRRVPPDVWLGRIDWDASAAQGHGLAFAAIRVAHPKWLEALTPPLAPEPKRTGRPSDKTIILEAYGVAQSASEIAGGEPMTTVARVVRVRAAALNPEDAGRLSRLHYETIRRTLAGVHPSNAASTKQ